MDDRMNDLMNTACTAFREQRNPFSDEWLVENDVTANECRQLSLLVAAAMSFFITMNGALVSKRDSAAVAS